MSRNDGIETIEFTEGFYKFAIKHRCPIPEVYIKYNGPMDIGEAPRLPKIHLPKDCNVFFDYCFANCSQLYCIAELRNWDTSNAVSFHGMFEGCVNLVYIGPISDWDTGKVTDMSHMFSGCRLLCTRFYDNLNWDTGNVTKMSYMFYGTALTLRYIDWIRTWNLSNVTEIYNMFGFTNTKGVIKLMNLPRAVSGQLIYSRTDSVPKRPIKGLHYWVAEGEPDEMIRVNCEHPELPPGIDNWFDVPV